MGMGISVMLAEILGIVDGRAVAVMMEVQMSRFTPATEQLVYEIERVWNLRDINAIVLGNTIDCLWRNRVNFLWGREQIRSFVERLARSELDYRVVCEPWAEGEQCLSIRFAAEFRNDSGVWFRVYGSEDMEFDDAGLVKRRLTAANEHPIHERERVLRWPAGPRPADHPTLTELGY